MQRLSTGCTGDNSGTRHLHACGREEGKRWERFVLSDCKQRTNHHADDKATVSVDAHASSSVALGERERAEAHGTQAGRKQKDDNGVTPHAAD